MEEPKNFVGEFGRLGVCGEQVVDGSTGVKEEEEEEEEGESEENEQEASWTGHLGR